MRTLVALVALAAMLAAGCGGDNEPATGLEDGRFGAVCVVAADCEGLRYGQLRGDNPALRESVECDAAGGPPVCRFRCSAPGGEEACHALGGACVSGACVP